MLISRLIFPIRRGPHVDFKIDFSFKRGPHVDFKIDFPCKRGPCVDFKIDFSYKREEPMLISRLIFPIRERTLC